MNYPLRCLLTAVTVALVTACGSSIPSSNPADLELTEAPPTTPPVTDSPAGSIAQVVANLPQSLPVSNEFANTEITEASGIQRSLSLPGVYYVHNDSGGTATLYATDATGQAIGRLQLSGVQATDWEAVAGARLNGQPHIIVADTGNNDRSRSVLNLQVVAEPDYTELLLDFNLALEATQIDISYADGLNYDAEAVFIDGDNDSVVVVTKDGRNTTAQSIWKGSLSSGLTDGAMVLEFRGQLAVPAIPFVNAVTDIDIHPDGRQLALLVYGLSTAGRIFLWQPGEGEGTADALVRAADREISVPVIDSNGQAEGISFSADGEALLVAAEGPATSTMTVVGF